MSTLAKSIALFMTEGSSDKEYHVLLVERGEGWAVDYKNGRRGKALRQSTKTASPVSYEKALEIYDKLVATKKKGGYTEQEDGRTFQDLPEGVEHSGVRVQLLGEVDQNDASSIEQMIDDPDWFAEQKHDGERRAVIKNGEDVIGTNRQGIIVPLPTTVVQAMLALEAEQIILDGEDMGDHIAIFDVLRVNTTDVRPLPFEQRKELYSTALQGLAGTEHEDVLRESPTARTSDEKLHLYSKARDWAQEGLVFKSRHAPYEAGRNNSQVKLKFKGEVTCQVIERNSGKRSASIGVLAKPLLGAGDVPTLTPVGNVTLPPSVEVKPGDLIEVQYLYAYPGGSLFQPVFKAARPDKTHADLATQLKFRGTDVVLDLDGLDGADVDASQDRLMTRERQ